MALTTFLATSALIHAAIYFTDQFLKSCINVPYLYFLENIGLTVKPLQLLWFTTAFNRSVTKWALWKPRFFRVWFTIGAVLVSLLLLPSIFLLLSCLVSYFQPVHEKSSRILEPVVPGINLPLKELPYYFATLLVASFIHEAGHAMAAVKEDVHVNGFGILLLFILPGAYVDVPTEEIRTLTPFRQLKILCAGVWHNMVLVICAFLICLSLPVLLQPLYMYGQGMMVLSLTADSPVRGPTGLQAGDVIMEVNHCSIQTQATWEQCIIKSITSDQLGFCIPESAVHSYDETIHHAFESSDGSVQCCSGDSEAHLCFELLEDKEKDSGVAAMQPFSCLPARLAISMSSKSCLSSASCPRETHCLAPSLKNATRLIRIKRQGWNSQHKEDVIYLGPPAYLYHTVSLTGYIPKFSILPVNWPSAIEIFCDYMVKFSGALAILNMVPVMYLDGYWIFGAVIDLLLSSHCDKVSRKVIHIIFTILGSILLLLNMILGIQNLL